MENIKNNKPIILSFVILFGGIIIMFKATVAYLTIVGCLMILIGSILAIIFYNRIKKTGGDGEDLFFTMTILAIMTVIFWAIVEFGLYIMKME